MFGERVIFILNLHATYTASPTLYVSISHLHGTNVSFTLPTIKLLRRWKNSFESINKIQNKMKSTMTELLVLE